MATLLLIGAPKEPKANMPPKAAAHPQASQDFAMMINYGTKNVCFARRFCVSNDDNKREVTHSMGVDDGSRKYPDDGTISKPPLSPLVKMTRKAKGSSQRGTRKMIFQSYEHESRIERWVSRAQ